MQRPDAVLPSQLLQVIRNGDPPELATILDMAYTASVVRKVRLGSLIALDNGKTRVLTMH